MEDKDLITKLKELYFRSTNKPMTDKEIAMAEGLLSDAPYKQIVRNECFKGITEKTLSKSTSPAFREKMKNLLGYKQSILKKDFKAAVKEKLEQNSPSPAEQDNKGMPSAAPTSSDGESSPDPQLPSPQDSELRSQRDDFFPKTSSTNTQYMQFTIALLIINPNTITEETLKRETRVKSIKPESLWGLFNRVESSFEGNNWRLEDLLQGLLLEKNQRWLKEFVESIYSASQGSKPQEVKSMFQSMEGKLFRASLDRIEKPCDDGSVAFIVIFQEHISRGYVENAPNHTLGTLATAIPLGVRLAWEVCDEFLPMLDGWEKQGLDAINRGLREVKNKFEYIEEDAEHRRQGEARDRSNKDRLRDSFESEEEKRTIEDNLSRQQDYKEVLKKADKYDKIDEATAALDEVRDALTQLKGLNKIIMNMVIRRLGELF